MRILLSFLLSFAIFECSAQVYAQIDDAGKSPAFEIGESLVYSVSYKASIVSLDVATVKMSVTSAKVNGTDCYHIHAVGRVNSGYDWFFDLYDVYHSYLDKSNLRPVYFNNDLKEGDYRYQSNIVYDWNSMMAKGTSHNLSREVPEVKILKLSNVSYDPIAIFYNMRSLSALPSDVGRPHNLEVAFSDTVRKIQYRFVGKEKKNIGKLGAFNTLVFKCQLADAGGEAFKDGTEFTMWLSDDKYRTPIYLESPIKIGSVRVTLINRKLK